MIRTQLGAHRVRVRQLAACIALTFGITEAAHSATLLVTDCSDGAGSGTLRHTIGAAGNNDTVVIQPGTCSKITLTAGQIPIFPDTLTISGPGSSALTISGGLDASPSTDNRIFAHNGSSLTISNVTIAEGKYVDTDFPIGGCIYSRGSVLLSGTVVTHCYVVTPSSASKTSAGGAIYAKGTVTLLNSTVSGNTVEALSTSLSALGGGIFATTGFFAKYSNVSNNTATSAGLGTTGGGLYSKSGDVSFINSIISYNSATSSGGFRANGTGSVLVSYSTMSGNKASTNSAFRANSTDTTDTVTISQSTISLNASTSFQTVGTYSPTIVKNSTIAMNRSKSSTLASGLYANASIKTYSSIFAGNEGYDIGVRGTGHTISGSGNFIGATTNAVPLGTLSGCPKVEALADNGGMADTIALQTTSPALNTGNLTGGNFTTDERGATRNVGGVDIGAFERQATDLPDDRVFISQFSGNCN